MPGTVLVGLGLRAAKSAAHCNEALSAHIGGSPITFGLPGMQVKPLLPSRRTTVCPCASLSTISAALAISGGPADMARSIFACAVSLASVSTPDCTRPASPPLTRFVPKTAAAASIAARVAFFELGLFIFLLLVRLQYDHA